ncbi:histidinol-phosphatase HisJ family protein [Nanoarchaeota archaeon]
MKPKVNFHLHSTGSDGKLKPEEVVKLSIKAGLEHICFTDHHLYPKILGKKVGWSGSVHHKEPYYKEVLRLKKKYAKKICIGYGAEFDWFEDYQAFTKKQLKSRPFDFILGAIHVFKLRDGSYFNVNDMRKDMSGPMKKYGMESIVKGYYKTLRNLIKSELFDCVAHFDVIKIRNADKRCFSEKSKWYKDEALKTLNVLQKSGMCMEINTGAKRAGLKGNYPAEWILKEAFKRRIPITIGSDGHKNVDLGLKEGYQMAKSVGYKTLWVFEGRKRREIKI